MARRRDTTGAGATVTASAQRIRLNAGAAVIRRSMGRRTTEQEEAWAYYDSVPELKHAVNFVANQLAKLHLFIAAFPVGSDAPDPVPAPMPGTTPDADAPPFPVSDAVVAAAREELAALRSDLGGQSEILRVIAAGNEVPGESFLVGFGPRDPVVDPRTGREIEPGRPQQWQVFSTSEIWVNRTTGVVSVKIDGKDPGAYKLDPAAGDEVVRIWLRHPRWSSRADSAVLGMLQVCRILEALGQEELAVTQSRLFAGVFKIPNGLLAAAPPKQQDGDTRHPLIAALDDAYTTPQDDPETMATIRPVFVRGERDDLASDVFGFVDASRARDDKLTEKLERWVRRFARGINLPVEVVEGHMATTFANAEQVDQDTFDDYLEPRANLIVDALTVGYLRPKLHARGLPPEEIEQVLIDYDPAPLIAQPDQAAHVTEGLKEGVISGRAWRETFRFTDDDAPDPAELIDRMATQRGITTPSITIALLQALAERAGVELPDPAVAAAEESAAAGAAAGLASVLRPVVPATAAVSTRTLPDLGKKLALIDTRTYDRIQQAASDAMNRALEKAGNKLRSKLPPELRRVARAVEPRLVAATVGRDAVTAAASDDELLDGAWTGMAATYASIVAGSQAEARRLTKTAVKVDNAAMAKRQADALAASWEWMEGELTDVALERLAVPIAADTITTAPPGLVRQALARAGGATEDNAKLTGKDDGWVATTEDGLPVGQIGTGTEVTGVLADGGAAVGKWTWQHISDNHPLPGHEDLDGVEFDSYDDPALANGSDFPPFDFYFPGDHNGCQCIAVPTIEVA